MLETANIFVTGGAGTLGHALARRRKQDGWTGRLTIYSTDTLKHEVMHREYPDIIFVQGDIRSWDTLYNSMVGHDVVIHAAAVKVIPTSEYWSMDTFDVNVIGSKNVCSAAINANIKHVLGISTDKSCHPANAYGASKMMMEKIFQEYSRQPFNTQFHLVRYGNVIESNGSVIQSWKKCYENKLPIKMTHPDMTRFWISPSQAVQCAIDAFELPTGHIFIPLLPSLSIAKLAEYSLSDQPGGDFLEPHIERIPMRPGEKMHETLLTIEEVWYCEKCFGKMGEARDLRPNTTARNDTPYLPQISETARKLTTKEFVDLLTNG